MFSNTTLFQRVINEKNFSTSIRLEYKQEELQGRKVLPVFLINSTFVVWKSLS